MAYVFQIEASTASVLEAKVDLVNTRSHNLEIIKSLFQRQESEKIASKPPKINESWGNRVDSC